MVLDDFEPNFTFYGEVPENLRGDIPGNPPGRKIRDFPRTEKYGFINFLRRVSFYTYSVPGK